MSFRLIQKNKTAGCHRHNLRFPILLTMPFKREKVFHFFQTKILLNFLQEYITILAEKLFFRIIIFNTLSTAKLSNSPDFENFFKVPSLQQPNSFSWKKNFYDLGGGIFSLRWHSLAGLPCHTSVIKNILLQECWRTRNSQTVKKVKKNAPVDWMIFLPYMNTKRLLMTTTVKNWRKLTYKFCWLSVSD